MIDYKKAEKKVKYVKDLMPSVIVFGGGALGRSLGHEGGTSRMALVPLQEETRKMTSFSPSHEDTVRRLNPQARKRVLSRTRPCWHPEQPPNM